MKRVRQTSATNAEKDENLEDLISGLPDDILINIISRLTLEEAGRTSVLASRWKYLWTSTTSLIFDGRKNLNPIRNTYPTKEDKSKYVNWVNKVLELNRVSGIDEFAVRFNLCCSFKVEITNWINAAISKRVQNLELDLWPGRYDNYYTFPQKCYNRLKSGHGLSCIKSLRSLCFNAVNVTGEILEHFIHNCPLLDRLCVANSSKLSSLKIVGSSIQLKYLDIQSCYTLEEIEISAPSLRSFKHLGRLIKLHMHNVPQLDDVSICVEYRRLYPNPMPMSNFIGQIISYFPQLKALELEYFNEVCMQISQHGELPKLRHLKLTVTKPNRQSILGLTSIMKACPFLQKLILKLEDRRHRIGKKRHLFPKYSHQHLKVVELHGFVGREVDLEFALYLLENAIMLEKMIVEIFHCMSKEIIRPCVQMLRSKSPEHVDIKFRQNGKIVLGF